MPNVGAVLREEITRLARKELRRQLAGTRKASAQYRRHIATLRRQVGSLEQQVSVLRTRMLDHTLAAATAADETRTRFVPAALRAHRARLGLSAKDYGRLVGVSAQTIYSWERKTSAPRAQQRTSLAAVRRLGKREARARLEAAGSRVGKRTRGF